MASAESEDLDVGFEVVESAAIMVALDMLDAPIVEATDCKEDEADVCSVVGVVTVALALFATEVIDEDSAERMEGLLPTPAIRENRVAARMPLSMILRLMMSRHTKPKSSSAARMSIRSRVSAFCIVVMMLFEALSRPEKDEY